MHPRIIQSPEAHWPFQAVRPVLHVGGGREPRAVLLHPAPAYPHDAVLVEQLLRHLEQVFPLPCPPIVYLPRHDAEGNVGAVTFDGTPREPGQPLIILFGKPTPIHPAVTRYLLAHEYGHAVADFVAEDLRGTFPRREVIAEYARIRGLPEGFRPYGPATWHLDPEEILANDFRVLVADVEASFWPHEAPHPGAEFVKQGDGTCIRWGDELRAWWGRRAERAQTYSGAASAT